MKGNVVACAPFWLLLGVLGAGEEERAVAVSGSRAREPSSAKGMKDAEPKTDAVPVPSAPRKAPAEVRAIWVTRWDFRTEEDVRKIVAACASLGLNRIVLQVRGQADAFYRSSLEPWGEDLEGAGKGGDPGFDPLEVAIEAAHERGISLVAWANILPAWKGAKPPRSRKHLVHAHPDWFMTDRDGKRRILGRDYAILNPCLPQVRAHIVAVISDIAARYPIDGLQLDYIRFLERDASRGEDVPYDPATLRLFRKETGLVPEDDAEAWDRFRRRAVDRLVADLAEAIRERRPDCSVSAAAIRDADRARSQFFQDAAGWKRRGWVDEVYPMTYEPDAALYEGLARDWTKACGSKSVVLGVGVHLFDGPDLLRQQIGLVRSAAAAARAAGYCLFSYSDFFPSASPESGRDAGSVARRGGLRAGLAAMNRPKATPKAKETPKAAEKGTKR